MARERPMKLGAGLARTPEKGLEKGPKRAYSFCQFSMSGTSRSKISSACCQSSMKAWADSTSFWMSRKVASCQSSAKKLSVAAVDKTKKCWSSKN